MGWGGYWNLLLDSPAVILSKWASSVRRSPPLSEGMGGEDPQICASVHVCEPLWSCVSSSAGDSSHAQPPPALPRAPPIPTVASPGATPGPHNNLGGRRPLVPHLPPLLH